MQVYVEDVFIDNFIINALLLFLTSRLMHLPTKFWKVTLGAFLGVLGVVLSLIIRVNGYLSIFYKILLSILMILTICPLTSTKKFLVCEVTFIGLTFALGGACTAICFAFGKPILSSNGEILYSLKLPMGIIIGIAFLLAWACLKLIKNLKRRLQQSNYYVPANLLHNGKTLNLRAFLDSGNTLIDPTNNKPVTFITYKSFCKMFEDIPLSSILLKKTLPNLSNAHYISLNTISNQKNSVLVFTIEKLLLTNDKKTVEINKPNLALTFSNLNKKLDSDLLISPLVLNGENL